MHSCGLWPSRGQDWLPAQRCCVEEAGMAQALPSKGSKGVPAALPCSISLVAVVPCMLAAQRSLCGGSAAGGEIRSALAQADVPASSLLSGPVFLPLRPNWAGSTQPPLSGLWAWAFSLCGPAMPCAPGLVRAPIHFPYPLARTRSPGTQTLAGSWRELSQDLQHHLAACRAATLKCGVPQEV